MKKIILILSIFILNESCTTIDEEVEITNIEFVSIESYDHYSKETEFFNSDLYFNIYYELDPPYTQHFYRSSNVIVTNPPIEETFSLTSNKKIEFNNVIIPKGEELMKYFKFETKHRHFSYNTKLRSNIKVKSKGYFKFYFKTKLSNNFKVSDSCLVKIN